MATLVSKSNFSNHSRSISLPTSSHPILVDADKHLRRLKSSQGSSSSSSTCTTTSYKLDGLRNLYECLDDVLQLTESQQSISREIRDGRWEEEILDGSLRLLDICNTARDTYTLMKESVQDLESSIRRKRGANLDKEIESYMTSKKKLNRVICNCFKELKREEKKYSISAAPLPLISQIKEAQEITLNLLQSCLSFISEPQPKGWSLVSKLLHQNKGESETSDIRNIEVELLLLNSKKSNKDVDLVRTQNLVKRLGALGESIQEMVKVLEAVYRLLLEGRVSLLNILNN